RATAGNIGVTVSGGTVYGANAGIRLDGGANNTIEIASGTTVTGGTDAILSTTGADRVNNAGTVTGNVDLGSGANAFNNLAGGLFNIATADVGVGNALTNSGTLAPGGIGTIATATLNGNLVQTASGHFAVDINPTAPAADQLTVTGTASLAGVITPKLTSLFTAPQTFTILTAAGGVTNNGLSVDNSGVVNYVLTFPTANDVQLAVNGINFGAASGLTPNEQAVAQTLQQAFVAG